MIEATHKPANPPLSVPQIAEKMGKKYVTIWKAIARTGEKPVLTAGNMCFYTEDIIPLIEAKLRKFKKARS